MSKLTKPLWKPFINFEEPLFFSVEDSINKLNQSFIDKYQKFSELDRKMAIAQSASPLTGYLGEVLYMFYSAEFSSNDKLHNLAVFELEQSLLCLNNKHLNLGNGLCGFLWLLNHAKNQGFIQDFDEFLEKQILEFSYKQSMVLLKNGIYDYVVGGLGICIPIIESKCIQKEKFFYLEQIIDSIMESVEKEMIWLYKLDTHDKYKNSKLVSLGLSHGIPSIIVIVSKILEMGLLEEKCKLILNYAVNFINSKSELIKGNSIYPALYNISTNEKYFSPNKLGWCYGDLGVAISLLSYNNYFNDSKIIVSVNKIVENSLDLINYKSIENVEFCHGFAGILHLYNRLYNNLENDNLLPILRSCIKQLLKKMKNEKIQVRNIKKTAEFKFNDNIGIVNGLAGTGLVLLACISKKEPLWDSITLTNISIMKQNRKLLK